MLWFSILLAVILIVLFIYQVYFRKRKDKYVLPVIYKRKKTYITNQNGCELLREVKKVLEDSNLCSNDPSKLIAHLKSFSGSINEHKDRNIYNISEESDDEIERKSRTEVRQFSPDEVQDIRTVLNELLDESVGVIKKDAYKRSLNVDLIYSYLDRLEKIKPLNITQIVSHGSDWNLPNDQSEERLMTKIMMPFSDSEETEVRCTNNPTYSKIIYSEEGSNIVTTYMPEVGPSESLQFNDYDSNYTDASSEMRRLSNIGEDNLFDLIGQ